MKTHFSIILFFLLPVFGIAQFDPTWGYITDGQVDSIKMLLNSSSNDTIKMSACRLLGFYYQEIKPDSGIYYHQQQLEIAEKLNIKMWQADANAQLGAQYNLTGNLLKSYEHFAEGFKIAEDPANESSNWQPRRFSNAKNLHESRLAIIGMMYIDDGNLYGTVGDTEKQKSCYWKSIEIGNEINNGKILSLAYGNFGGLYRGDSALAYNNKALAFAKQAGYNKYDGSSYLANATIWLNDKSNMDSAIALAYQAVKTNIAENNLTNLIPSYSFLSFIYSKKHHADSCRYYADKTLATAQISQLPLGLLTAYIAMTLSYKEANKIDSALKYMQIAGTLNDSLKNEKITKLTDYQSANFKQLLHLKQLEDEKAAYENRIKVYGLIAGLGVFLLIALLLYRNNLHKQKANNLLAQQKAKIESTLIELKSTQHQLIESEKMAAFGVMASRVAHEIQNPLNFVNNFSELSQKLIEEIVSAKNEDEKAEASKTLIENLQTITLHGKRAGNIVRQLQEHTNKGTAHEYFEEKK